MISKILRKLFSLSFFIKNVNTFNFVNNQNIKNEIFTRLKKIKKNSNLKKTHIKFNKELISLLKSGNLNSFLREDFIQKMFFLHNRLFVFYELLELKKDKKWKLYKNLIIEDDIGDPIRYFLYIQSSGNRINHAYHLKILSDHIKINLSKIREVFEFGGGYGCMARIFTKINKSVNYTIFDTQIVNFIQFYYLKSLNLKVGFNQNKIKLVHKQNYNKRKIKNSLFIANWSISETPLTFRKKFIKEILRREFFLISFQEKFENVDNLKYFLQLQSILINKFSCKIIENKYYKGNYFKKQKHYFFIGRKL